jgi:hypothetical protein
MNRAVRIALIVLGVLVFLVISAVLARYLTTDNAERDADLGLLKAEAAGNAPLLISQIQGCAAKPSCVTLERQNAQRLRRPGAPKIVNLQSATANAPDTQTGQTRIAWTIIGGLPVVQCILVHRTGSALTGLSVTLLGLSAPINNSSEC